VTAPSRRRAAPGQKRELKVPDYFSAALKQNKRAAANFEKFSFSHKREYVEWLVEAKREETRQKRLATALAWLAEGKPQNWKYMKC
ncbi:MAG TPA: YdeI/OmpD-associated family protein, partial [Verrucomicrobiae bacterium]|nr:YdeI/OmpD-associated family protein [Verrucomicrobiae bacterium]